MIFITIAKLLSMYGYRQQIKEKTLNLRMYVRMYVCMYVCMYA